MVANQVQDLPIDIRKTCWRFERWRRSHTGRLPIPVRDAVPVPLPPHSRDPDPEGFLPTPPEGPKPGSAPVFTPECPRTISQLCPSRVARCGREIASGVSQREDREKLLATARRRDMDVVLVRGLER